MTEARSLYDRTGRRKYVNADERRRFHLATQQVESLRDRAFLQTLLYSGCRISEALEIMPQRIDISNQTLVFRTLKQHGALRYRSVPVPDILLGNFRKIIEGEGVDSDQPIWNFCRTTGWLRVKDCMAKAGIVGEMATCKGLRHGFAIRSIQEKIDTFTVQKWLGHSKAETTAIYLGFVGEDERVLAQRTWNGLLR